MGQLVAHANAAQGVRDADVTAMSRIQTRRGPDLIFGFY